MIVVPDGYATLRRLVQGSQALFSCSMRNCLARRGKGGTTVLDIALTLRRAAGDT